MMSMKTIAGSNHRIRRSRSEILVSKKSIFDRIYRGVQRRRGENARRLLKDSTEDNTRQSRQNHVAPVGQRLRSIVEMRAAEYKSGREQCAVVCSKALHDPVLNQPAKQDFFRQCGGAKDDQIAGGDLKPGHVRRM